MALVTTGDDYSIKPEAHVSPISTSDWPLLLKNYSERKYHQFLECSCLPKL
jgi:phage gp29-like protein